LAGGALYTAGQIGLDPATGDLVQGGAAAQARRALTNLAAVVAAAGLSMTDTARATLYLADLADFAAVNEVYAEFFGEAPPARAAVQVASLPLGAQVMIDLIVVAS
ncbi:Rid family detoxifying hydrolase, partial [bacterium]|nr:Rid family detoxifying hydrolase [bacterium]